MNEPPDRQVAALFDELSDLSPADRSARLNGLTTLEHEVAAHLRELLGAADAAGDFLGALPVDPAERPLAATEGAAGEAVGPYRLIRLLGRGGTGVVWLAHDSQLERPVALKLYRGRDTVTAERMRTEARMAARLDHPHVAIVHEIGVSQDGVPFMAMAWSTAGSLADRIATGPVPVALALNIAIQAAQALDAAHGAGIVHRDVKPGNLLLSDEAQVRLADFGAAHWAVAGNDSAPALGTLRYLAPEQLRSTGVDHRADLWALGVTLYQALTGRLPFDGGSAGAVLYNVTRSEPTPPGRLALLPPALSTLILELLAKNPADRPATAALVALRLEEIRVGVLARERSARAPAPTAPLLGRDAEVERALALLGERRLITLTGPGGTGKTRLGLELALRAESRYVAGCCFVELAALPDGDQAASLIAQALGISQGGSEGVVEQLLRGCRGVERLLLLDNCEHLGSLAELVTTLLGAAPELSIIATSRSPLGVVGEQEFPVPPLALAAIGECRAEQLLAVPAVGLLVARICDREPDFAVTDANAAALAEICRRLDGLPLAIELAAARVRTLGAAAVAERLAESTAWLHAGHDHRPARHQTLDSAIAWSYALLDESEQRLFRHLAPFVGGFDAAAVRAVAASIGLGRSGDDLLESLIEKSLVMPANPGVGVDQCSLLMTIRTYAMARLREHGEEPMARASHAEFYLARATAAAAETGGRGEPASQARLRANQANLHDALDWLITTGAFVPAARLAVALHRHWLLSGWFMRDIVARLECIDRGLTSGAVSVPTTLHADLLRVLGSLSGLAGEHQRIPAGHFERARAMYRETGSRRREALVLNHLGWSSLLLGRYAAAEQYSTQARQLHERNSDPTGVSVSLTNLGWVAVMRAELADAERHFAAALAIREPLGDRRAIAYANGHLGTVALARGDATMALRYYNSERMAAFAQLGDRVAGPTFELRRILALHALGRDGHTLRRVQGTLLPQLRESSHAWSVAFALAVLARLLIDGGDPDAAGMAVEEGERVADVAGLVSLTADCQALRAEALLRAGRFGDAAASLAASIEVRLRTGEPLGIVAGAERVGEWLAMLGRTGPALLILAGSAAARAELGTARLPRCAELVTRIETRMVAEMSADRVARARRDAAALTWRELGRTALSELAK